MAQGFYDYIDIDNITRQFDNPKTELSAMILMRCAAIPYKLKAATSPCQFCRVLHRSLQSRSALEMHAIRDIEKYDTTRPWLAINASATAQASVWRCEDTVLAEVSHQAYALTTSLPTLSSCKYYIESRRRGKACGVVCPSQIQMAWGPCDFAVHSPSATLTVQHQLFIRVKVHQNRRREWSRPPWSV